MIGNDSLRPHVHPTKSHDLIILIIVSQKNSLLACSLKDVSLATARSGKHLKVNCLSMKYPWIVSISESSTFNLAV